MIGKLIVIGLVLFLLVGGVSYVFDNAEEPIKELTVKNPMTGEVWDSIEEYRFRNENNRGVDNGDD